MDDKNSGSPSSSVVWPTLVTIVIGLYGYTKFMPQLESVRPKDVGSPTASGNDDVKTSGVGGSAAVAASYPSRQWEDPLGDHYRKGLRRLRQAQLGATVSLHDMPLLLPVMVPGGLTSDDKEVRMRTRYAVNAALIAAVYQPESEMSMNDLVLEVPAKEGCGKRRILVPYELFRPDNCRRTFGVSVEATYTEVLVCWLADDQGDGDPLSMIGELRTWADRLPRKDTKNRLPIEIHAIGPSNSNVLLDMVRRQQAGGEGLLLSFSSMIPWPWTCAERRPRLDNVQLYLTRSTIEPCALKSDDAITIVAKDLPPGVSVRADDFTTNSTLTVEACNRFLRRKNTVPYPAAPLVIPVIGTDWHLARAIREELRRRGAWPNESSHDDYIAIVTERDTLYGRSIPFLFASLLPERGAEERAAHGRWPLLVYKFLRGIDGSLVAEKSGGDEKKGDDDNPRARDSGLGFVPEGNNQIDYLRRMTEDLVERDREMKQRGGKGVQAIGVVGTDPFDKLLVLRALRLRFPRTWFFTNDLDANYYRPSEIDNTQNLLVASHFGLTLHSSLQREVPPFRDSYQTATFLGALMAVGDRRTHDLLRASQAWSAAPTSGLWPAPAAEHDDRLDDFELAEKALRQEPQGGFLKPLVFEIGRDGAYQLTKTGDILGCSLVPPSIDASNPDLVAAIQPASFRELTRPRTAPWFWVVVGGAALIGLLAIIFTSVRRAILSTKLVTPVLVVGVLLLGLIIYDHTNPEGQPFCLFAGISIWPAVVLRTLAGMLGIVFVVVGQDKLKKNENEMCGPILKELRTTPAKHAKKRFWQTVWHWAALSADEFEGDATEVLRSAIRHGRPLERIVRAVTLSLLFAVFGLCLLFASDSFPNLLARGATAWAAAWLAWIFGALGLLFVTFFVVDALRLGQLLVRHLGRQAGSWPEQVLCETEKARWTATRKALGPPPTRKGEARSDNMDGLSEQKAIREIAKYTDVLNKLIWYPFIVMLLDVVAGQRAFCGWGHPLSIVMLQLALLAVLYFHTWRLRIEANDARDTILQRLRDECQTMPAAQSARREHLEAIIDDIQQVQSGAYSHWTQDYFVKAMSLPFLGEGGIVLLDRVLRSM